MDILNNILYFFKINVLAVDIIILMRMCYYDENNNLVQDSISIIKHYLSGWFIIDIISVIPL